MSFPSSVAGHNSEDQMKGFGTGSCGERAVAFGVLLNIPPNEQSVDSTPRARLEHRSNDNH